MARIVSQGFVELLEAQVHFRTGEAYLGNNSLFLFNYRRGEEQEAEFVLHRDLWSINPMFDSYKTKSQGFLFKATTLQNHIY